MKIVSEEYQLTVNGKQLMIKEHFFGYFLGIGDSLYIKLNEALSG